MTSPRLTISSNLLLAEINPLGAELVRLTTRDGHELLWDGKAAVWAGHAPILFPIVGMLNRGRYRLNDKAFAMPKHGFARNSLFDLIECRDSDVTLRIQDSDATRATYPFAFRLDISFELSGPALAVIARVTNRDVRAMPVSFGFHPALRWPLPFGAARGDHRLIFSSDEPAPVRRINAAGLLDPTPHASPVIGRILRLRDELFVDDAIIFDRLQSAALEYGADGFPAIVMTFTNLPHLGIWTKPGAGFICIEPWQGYNDAQGFEGDIWSKPGIIAVAPGTTCEFSMNISVKGSAAIEPYRIDNSTKMVGVGKPTEERSPTASRFSTRTHAQVHARRVRSPGALTGMQFPALEGKLVKSRLEAQDSILTIR